MLSREVAIRSQPRMAALLRRIKERLEEDEIGGFEDLVAEIDRELLNAEI